MDQGEMEKARTDLAVEQTLDKGVSEIEESTVASGKKISRRE